VVALTWFTPSEEPDGFGSVQPLLSRKSDGVASGRITEELIFGEEEVTTGASNDPQQVVVSRQMVTIWHE